MPSCCAPSARTASPLQWLCTTGCRRAAGRLPGGADNFAHPGGVLSSTRQPVHESRHEASSWRRGRPFSAAAVVARVEKELAIASQEGRVCLQGRSRWALRQGACLWALREWGIWLPLPYRLLASTCRGALVQRLPLAVATTANRPRAEGGRGVMSGARHAGSSRQGNPHSAGVWLSHGRRDGPWPEHGQRADGGGGARSSRSGVAAGSSAARDDAGIVGVARASCRPRRAANSATISLSRGEQRKACPHLQARREALLREPLPWGRRTVRARSGEQREGRTRKQGRPRRHSLQPPSTWPTETYAAAKQARFGARKYRAPPRQQRATDACGSPDLGPSRSCRRFTSSAEPLVREEPAVLRTQQMMCPHGWAVRATWKLEPQPGP